MSGILNVLLAGNSAAAPAAPSGISGAAYTSGSVTFNYTAGSDSGLPITNYRAVSGGINYAVTYTSSVITVSGLTNGTTYDFYLQAFNSSGWGALSTTHTGSITPYAGTLTAPSITSWTSNATNTTFNWGTVTSATSYQIDFQNAGTFALNTASLTTNYASTAASVVIKIYAIATGWINSSTTTYTATYTTPGTPTSVAAALVATSGTLSVSFTPSTTIGGGSNTTSGLIKQYNVYVNGGLSVSYTGSSSPISCGSLTVGTSYTFQITQVNYANLESAKSTASTGVAAPGVPAAPTIGTATATGTQTATLAFTANATNGYPITSYQAFTSGGTSVNIVSSTASSLSLNGLTQGTSYQFYMKVVNAIGTSAQSGTSTPAITTWTTPSAPTMGTVTVSGTTITIPWTAPASTGGTGIDYYYLYTGATLISSTIASSAVSYSYTGVKNTAYTFTIYAHNSVGLGTVSATSNSVTCTGVPDPPTMGTATVSGLNLSFPWAAPTNTGGLTIDVYRVDINGTTYTTTALPSKNPTTGIGVANNTYYCEMYAHNSAGWSGMSNRSNTVTCYDVPGAASSLSFTQTGLTTGNLTFTNPASNGATIDYYHVYIGGSYSQQVNSAGSPLALTSISNGSIITIYAHNAAGFGGVSASTTASMVGIPGNLSITVSNSNTSAGGRFDLSFTMISGAAATSWRICSFTNSGDWSTGLTDRYIGSSNPVTLTGYTNGTLYHIAAYGINVAGISPNWSGMLDITPTIQLSQPAITTTIDASFITWTWPAVSNASSYNYKVNSGAWISLAAGAQNLSIQLAATASLQVYALGSGVYGNSLITTSNVAISVPYAPAIGTATAGANGSSASVAFTAPYDGGGPIDAYQVYANGTATASGPSSPVSCTGLAEGNYTFTVRAHNIAGWGPQSGASNQITLVLPNGVPYAPSPYSTTNSGTTGSIYFTAGGDHGYQITAYRIYDGNTGVYYNCTGTTSPLPITNSLTFGQTYSCYLMAYNSAGWGAWSSPISLYMFVPPTSGALAYSNLTSTSVLLTETMTGGDTCNYFQVYTYPGYSSVGSYTSTGSQSLTLVAGTAYSYVVYCGNRSGAVWTNSISFTSPAAAVAPTTPTYSITGLTANAYTITLTSSSGANYYYLYETTGGGYTSLGYVSAGGSFGISGKSPSSTQSYQGYATNGVGPSGNVSFSVTTLAATPTFTTINASGATSGNTFATMWGYSFACTISATYQFDGSISGTSQLDSYMYLYDAAGSAVLTSDDDAGPGYSSLFTYTCTAGTTYIVKIRDYYSASGTASLTITKL